MNSLNRTTHPVSRDPTSAEISRFITSRTSTEMMMLVHEMREQTARATFTSSLPALLAVHEPTMAPKKAKKAVNSFMGFRGYYHRCPVFSGIPMMKCSGPISKMWNEDPNQPVWALIAKAWSIIRDQLRERSMPSVPLSQFVDTICPFLGIPAPTIYMEGMGWELDVDAEGSFCLIRISTITAQSFDVGVKHATLSAEEIIGYFQSAGFAQDYVPDTTISSLTFLTHSTGSATGRQNTVPALPSLHDLRMENQEWRRHQRQDMRNTGIGPAMQQQIAETHATGLPVPMRMYVAPVSDEATLEDSRFYSELISFILNNCTQSDLEEATSTTETSADTSAFRDGADEDATLPPMGSTNP